ncbi:GldM family protein [Flavobacterium okayamense]|uniref:Gliding motility-associated protein GldM second immunoglobulin-like domain-containing protein n=1 Tax=Flavobacterium okayamense TaxID=2830782 RepID=A0ABM7S3V9_9FLAO|nr:GldM family protein [Flavobacterium okayamense]BCY27806.1 hypothetical protein KK2020170_06740 [Flavobacterium okayamense]
MKYIIFLLFSFSIYAQDTIPATKSVIALDKMNVVYRGIANPISLAVNDAKSYKVYGKGVSKDENGNYFLSPGTGLTTKVYVEITKIDDTVVFEEHEFRIKGIPFPIATINDEYSTNGILVLFKDNFKDATIRLKIPDFYLEYNAREITSFSVSYKKKVIYIEGNKINKEALDLILKAKKNSFIIINNIKFKQPPNVDYRKIEPLLIKLVD